MDKDKMMAETQLITVNISKRWNLNNRFYKYLSNTLSNTLN